MRKIFRNNAQGIVDALTKIIAKKGRGTRILEKINLANPKWGARDRNLVHSATYEILRWKSYYRFLSTAEDATDEAEKPWKLLGVWLVLNEVEIPEWDEFKNLDVALIKAKQKEKVTPEISKAKAELI